MREAIHIESLALQINKRGSRRHVLEHVLMTAPWIVQVLQPNNARAEEMMKDRKIAVTLQSPSDSLGVEIGNGMDGTVRIKSIITPNSFELQEGMVVDGVSSAQELISRLRSGPYPIEVTFTDDNRTFATESSAFQSLTKVSTKRSDRCDVVATRGQVMEIAYEAYYVTSDGREILYDASSFRGTGQPYQMVLGSGDMIQGVDQGVAGMCVGESRTLRIPTILGHGVRSRKLFGIPDDHLGLIWKVELIRAESPAI